MALKVVAAIMVTALLGWRIKHAYRTESIGRRHLLDGFLEAIPGATISEGTQSLPRLAGSLDGHRLTVGLTADTLALRTLPTLWLEARWHRPHEATFDVMMNPSGTEYFAEDPLTATRVAPPAGWPDTTVARVAAPQAVPLVHRLATVDPAHYPALKHVLVTADELRVTMTCARADRQTYRVLRSASFSPDSVSAAMVEHTIAALRDLEAAVAGAAPPETAEAPADRQRATDGRKTEDAQA